MRRYASTEGICQIASIVNAWAETCKRKKKHHQLPSFANVLETDDRTSQTEEMSMDADLGMSFCLVFDIASASEFDDDNLIFMEGNQCSWKRHVSGGRCPIHANRRQAKRPHGQDKQELSYEDKFDLLKTPCTNNVNCRISR